jgi:parvulin-like peptidyl-prolyl isomerase
MRREARSRKPEARSTWLVLVVCLLASGFWLLASLHAETLDKIVAVVDGRIITRSDVRQESTVRSLLGEKAIDDDAVIQQLIEGYMIESQLAGFPGINVTDDEIAEAVAKLQKKDGVSPRALHDAVLRRMRTARYLDVRFRQFLVPSDQDVRKYYDEVFIREAQARGLNPVPPLEQVRDAIRKNVLEEQLDHEVSIWLEAVRRRSNIEILK